MDAHQFINRIRSLYNIDRHKLPELSTPQWHDFQDDPPRFLMRCDDETAEAIWRQVEARQARSANPTSSRSIVMSEKLKPCPFCGGEAETQVNGLAQSPFWEVVCDACDFCGPSGYSEAEAIIAWNRRIPSPSTDSLREAVEALTEARAALTAPTIGTVHMDDPDWYQQVDRAVASVDAALTKLQGQV